LADNSKIAPLISPPDSITVDLKTDDSTPGPKSTVANEIDVTDKDYNKLILYTDGRQLRKATDNSHVEIAGHWEGSQLVSDEKSPLSGKMSRTFALSPDGRQLYETLNIENGKKKPLVIRFVYDERNADAAAASDGSDDSNAPVLKRKYGDGESSQ